ncbi:methyltransferase domain-containing protein [candidate division GN15 bacterium]|nr:methyltransferase domain-containing protein [candidate division GN15 bacterium]
MSDPTGGYRDFPFAVEFYDYLFGHNAMDDVDFYVDLARSCGDTALELGSGTGRVLFPMARSGISVTGLDLSKLMLARCEEKLAEEPPEVQNRIELVHGDMRQFYLGRKFPFVYIPFRSFQALLTVEDQIQCLTSVRQHLEADGRFVMSLFNPSMELLVTQPETEEFGAEPAVILPDERRIVLKHRNFNRDLFRQTFDADLIYLVTHPNGDRERLVQRLTLRWLYRYEAEHLLYRCGFEVLSVYADFKKKEFGAVDPGELIFICKPAD